MPAEVHLLIGLPQSGKTAALLEDYRRHLRQQPLGACLWLAPSGRAAAEVRQRLVASGDRAFLAPGITTFGSLAADLLRRLGVTARPLTEVFKRELLERIVEELNEQGRLPYFRPIVGRQGLIDLLADFISEMKRLEVWPEHLAEAFLRGPESGESPGRPRRTPLPDGKHAELIEVYSRYQQLLAQFDLYDAEGLLWLARDGLRRAIDAFRSSPRDRGQKGRGNAPTERPCEGPLVLRHVVVDGFTDFTRTQHEMLDALAQIADQLWISLPLEERLRRKDLFRKPQATLSEMQRRHARMEVHHLCRREAPRQTAFRPLAEALFSPPRAAPPPAESAAGITIIAAARVRGELEAVAARVKQLLLSGVPADEIAVVFRLAPADDSPFAEVCAAFGIPVSFESGAVLGSSGAAKFFVRLLSMAATAWSARELRAVAANSYFQPAWDWWTPAAAAAACCSLARLRGASSVEQLREGLCAMAQLGNQTDAGGASPNHGDRNTDRKKDRNEEDNEEDSAREQQQLQRQAADAAVALKLVEAVEALFAGVPIEAPAAQWPSVFEQLAEQTGLLRVCAEPAATIRSPAVNDAVAWSCLLAGWRARSQLDARLGRGDELLTRKEVLSILEELLRCERLPPAAPAVGRVRALSAAGARGLRFRHLFVAGMSEGAFPLAQREDRAMSPSEYEQLASCGLPLPRCGDQSCDEMLLFYEVLSCAEEHIYLTYPAIDEAARPMNRSSFVDAVENVFGAGKIERIDLTDLRPLPAGDQPLSFDQWRLRAAADALDGRTDLLAALIGSAPELRNRVAGRHTAAAAHSSPFEPGQSIADAFELLWLRSRPTFTAAEGIIELPKVRARLAEMFSDRQTFSASELEAYATCPFRFLVERVLELEQTGEEVIGPDYAYRGRLAHKTLELLHERIARRGRRGSSPLRIDEAEWPTLLDEAFRDALSQGDRYPPGSIAEIAHRIDNRAVRRWLDGYRKQYEKYENSWDKTADHLVPVPTLFETGFGFGRSRNRFSAANPLELSDAGRTVALSGRIDRIDEMRVGSKSLIVIIDYKTGRAAFNKHEFDLGRALQLPVYCLAACELILADRDTVPIGAGYWQLREGGFQHRKMLQPYAWDGSRAAITNEWEDCRSRLPQIVCSLVEGLQTGQFPVFNSDADCTGRCPRSTLCRINTIRALEKQWTLPVIPAESQQSPKTGRGNRAR